MDTSPSVFTGIEKLHGFGLLGDLDGLPAKSITYIPLSRCSEAGEEGKWIYASAIKEETVVSTVHSCAKSETAVR